MIPNAENFKFYSRTINSKLIVTVFILLACGLVLFCGPVIRDLLFYRHDRIEVVDATISQAKCYLHQSKRFSYYNCNMIYEFTYKGKKYTSATGEMPEVLSYTQGETVQVYFYVDDPQNNGMLFYYIFGAAGLAAVAILYMIVRKREKK